MNMLNEMYIIIYLIIFQFRMIFPYWFTGVLAGSFISVFASGRINKALSEMGKRKVGYVEIFIAAVLGAVSPICMYGTVPLIASLGRKGIPQNLLAAFMVCSILINPNLFIFSFALGAPIAFIRLFACLTAGVLAGILTGFLFKGKVIFNFKGFDVNKGCSDKLSSLKTFLSSVNRGILKTAPYFFTGLLLTALFDRYVDVEGIFMIFSSNSKFGVILAASLGVPVYVCGGGTIPLLKTCLDGGMSLGAAVAFMITGPATKMTNLSAVKSILGIRNFILYIFFNLIFAIIAGFLSDMLFFRL